MKRITILCLIIFLFESSAFLQAASPLKSVRVVRFNVWYGFSKAPEQKAKALKYLNEQKPDIVSLQELNGYRKTNLEQDAIAWGHPYSELLKEDGFPTGITSSAPIEDVQITKEGFHHGLLRCQTHGLYVYVIHLHPSNWELRRREINLLLKDIDALPANSKIILAGDFNTFSPRDQTEYNSSKDLIPFFERLDKQTQGNNLKNGKIDYWHIEKLEQAGLVDVIASQRNQFDGTFPTELRRSEDLGPERRLDYIFCSPNLINSCISAQCLVNSKTSMLSDHYPVTATFQFEKQSLNH
ncbi:endonuclease/exonuclease/phosphatase family protein [Rubinisphaera italica]|uniref:Endonuclease/exonuclease/phosphatase domain-containing protein n=1 Tax=Rubinisphaera italica TaxID=2527969 RepID=A0A5C5XE97_9PLAN|nr:endonuclease/exonuclease/phosphatase family protein [Rubinisphaera italica]TWT61436.1 hypothetical protein Pan54_21720 [Rubinisphaera italica]